MTARNGAIAVLILVLAEGGETLTPRPHHGGGAPDPEHRQHRAHQAGTGEREQGA